MGDRVDETKLEPVGDVSEDSVSSPEQDGEPIPDQPQPTKRKGGRKPIYATSEERKQRNRQAQAAFRERRTEYIKQLETTIKHHEDTLQTLQQSHRTAADECLMLRYKNSLLERILLEKGIDVQAELRAKTGSPSLPAVRMPQQPVAPPQPVQRLSNVGKGHQPRRYITHPPPKVDTTPQMAPLPESVLPNVPMPSPRSHPTPSQSHFSSPATAPTRSPNFFAQQGTAISPNLPPQGPQQSQRHTQPPLRPNIAPMHPPQRPPLSASYNSSSTVSSTSSNLGGPQPPAPTSASTSTPGSAKGFSSNPFQSHYDQLDQEYDTAADMVDADDAQSPQGPAPFPQAFQGQGAMQPPPQPMHNTPHMGPQQTTPHMGPQQGTPHLGPQQQPMHHTPTLGPQQQAHQSPFQQPQDAQQANGQFGAINGQQQNGQPNNMFFDPYDPMLDADPFGLSASMHFPTQFSYDVR